MNAKDVIQTAAGVSQMILMTFISDLEDADLIKRPGPGCNHIAWQLGHLVESETRLLAAMCPGKEIELPEGFAETHGRKTEVVDDSSKYCTKQEYIELFEKARAASLAALAELPEEQLDAPNPVESMKEFLPTVGGMFTLMVTHPMMHAGQFVPVRRSLDKPVLI